MSRSRSRITIGVLTGVAVVAVGAIPSLASPVGTAQPGSTTPPAATVTATVTATSARAASATVAAASSTTVRPAAAAVAAKPVRSVKLVIPTTTNKVGANVTGFIQVLDTLNKVATPVPGVEVGFEQKRGAKWVEIASGATDESGTYAIAFTSDTNETLRAVLKPSTGKPVYGTIVRTSAVAQVTWASRPIVTATKKTKVKYSFRVNPEQGTAQLQIASAKTPTAWLKTTAVAVPNSGVVIGSVVFPSAGTWIVRGASVGGATVAGGYTSSVTVTVS